MIVLKPEEMAAVDQVSIKAGFPELLLMETAGRGVAEEAARSIGAAGTGEILLLIGKGNNGGDGLVAARWLDMWGYRVRVLLLWPGTELKGSTGVNYRLCCLRELELIEYDQREDRLTGLFERAVLIIDAMLGTGIKGKVREPVASIIELVNRSGKRVLAVDIPSGLDGRSGEVSGQVVRADLTVTMAYPKLGLLLDPGRNCVGKLRVVDLGVPAEYAEQSGYQHHLLSEQEASALLPDRPTTGHKGTFGKIGIVGGSDGMAGAPALSGLSALRSGAGLVKVATPALVQPTVAAYSPELLTVGLAGIGQQLVVGDLLVINELMAMADVMAVGPGLGCSKAAQAIVNKLIEEYPGPLVIDADGLNVLENLELLGKRKQPLLLTPHPGEMATLLKMETKEVQADRTGLARAFARRYGVYLILKGAATVIALPDGRVFINTTGNEGMATAGSGDVLTGIIAGLLGQGLAAEKAAILGPYLHGLAGELAGVKLSSFGVVAGDIIKFIPAIFQRLSKLREKQVSSNGK